MPESTVSIVIVSHSAKIANGIRDLAMQMTQQAVIVEAAGGVDDTTIGTNVQRIIDSLNTAMTDAGVVLLVDLGSAVMTAEMAIDMLPPDQQERVVICDAPIVEGAVIAAIESSVGRDLAAVQAAAEAAGNMQKVSRKVN